MKTQISASLILSMLLNLNVIAGASNFTPPHANMAHNRNTRGLAVPESSAPSHNLSPSNHGRIHGSAPTAITDHPSPNTHFSSLKSLINSSLWMLHLSKTLTDIKASEAVEQVYTHSLDEIEKKSASLAALIIDGLKEKNDGHFRQFVEVFRRSTENEKNGFSVLASKVEECMSQAGIRSRTYNYHAAIKEIISQSQSSTVSFSEISLSLKELINRLGLYIVGMHSTALEEFMQDGNNDEYTNSQTFVRKAFSVYTWLNNHFCASRTKDTETPESVFSDARSAESKGEYNQAITLYYKVIGMNSAYAAQNGCYYHIAGCHEKLREFSNAVDAYKKSIRNDATDPYKRSSFNMGLHIFLAPGYLPQTEATYLDALNYLNEVKSMSDDPYIRQSVWYEIGGVYSIYLARLNLTAEKKEEYYLLGIDAYRSQIAGFADTTYLEDFKKPPSVQNKIGSTYNQLAIACSSIPDKHLKYLKEAVVEHQKVLDQYPQSSEVPYAAYNAGLCCNTVGQGTKNKPEAEDYYTKAIEYFKFLRSNYYENGNSSYALYMIGSCQWSLGYYIHYNDLLNNGHPMMYDRENLKAAIATFQQFQSEYPTNSYITSSKGMAASCHQYLAESYYSEEDTNQFSASYAACLAIRDGIIADPAIGVYEKASMYNSNSLNYLDLARAVLRINGNISGHDDYCRKAIAELEKLMSLNVHASYNFWAAVYLGNAYLELGNYTAALDWYDKAENSEYAAYGQTTILYGRLQVHFMLGDYAKSLEYAEKAEALYPAGKYWGYYKGRCYYELGQYELARTVLPGSIGVNMPTYHDNIPVDALLYYGMSLEKLELYPDAFRQFAGLISGCHDKKRFTRYVSQADAAIDRIVRIEIDQEDTFNDDGTVTVNLSARPVYADGNQFTIIGEGEWTWELKGGSATLTQNANHATITTDMDSYGEIVAEAKFSVDVNNYGMNSKELPFIIWLKGFNPFSPLKEIINNRKEFLIYDVKGYDDAEPKNVLYPCEQELSVFGATGEPIAAKYNESFPLTLKFKPNKKLNHCTVKSSVRKSGTVVIPEISTDILLSTTDETMKEIFIECPGNLSTYEIILNFTFDQQENPAKGFLADTKGKHELFVLYDAPKLISERKDQLDIYRLFNTKLDYGKVGFVKKNIARVFQYANCLSAISLTVNHIENIELISDYLQKDIIDNVRKKYGFGYKHLPQYPFEIFEFPHNSCECITYAALMAQFLNILGIQAACEVVGDMVTGETYTTGHSHGNVRSKFCPVCQMNVKHYIVEQYGGPDSWCGNWEGVCFVDELKYCYDIAMEDENIQGTYTDLLIPKQPNGIVQEYIWIQETAPTTFPFEDVAKYECEHFDEQGNPINRKRSVEIP
ncbi:MAG: tetratricopeptide repeat protein [Candidatus Wallbacteria bacterium]|nr:tetratricopeptide repeat protein [Candidatus Wallbacteria bacterium]